MSPAKKYNGCGPLPEQVEAVLPLADAVAQACARTVFASTWGDAIERAEEAVRYPDREEAQRGAAPDGFELPNLSGQDLCKVAPHDAAPARFAQYARDAVAQFIGAAFAHVNGAAILDRLRELDPEEVGHTLALDIMGTGAGDWDDIGATAGTDDCAPRMDCDGRLYLDLSEVWRPDFPSRADLERLRDVRGQVPAPEVLDAIGSMFLDTGLRARDVLEHCADALAQLGADSVELASGERLHYVNCGETYADTLTWDGSRYVVQSWGAALEESETARTIETGESRCPHCGEWSAELLRVEVCEHCGEGS